MAVGFIGADQPRYGRSGIISLSEAQGVFYGAGNVIQTQTAQAGPARQTIATLTPTVITGLSIDFTPLFANSKIILRAYIQSSDTYVVTFGFYKDGSSVASTSGYTNNNAGNMITTSYGYDQSTGNTQTNYSREATIMWAEDAGNTSERTYDVRNACGWSGTPYTNYVHDRGNSDMAGFSFMEVIEVAQ